MFWLRYYNAKKIMYVYYVRIDSYFESVWNFAVSDGGTLTILI